MTGTKSNIGDLHCEEKDIQGSGFSCKVGQGELFCDFVAACRES